jgi:hypothetical protein
MAGATTSSLSEAEVVTWLKRSLKKEGLSGRAVGDIFVDADGSYVNSPFKKELEPNATIWIGGWRPDLVCLVQGTKTELIVGFEVKAHTDHEKGVVQASRYRNGVHEAYLCVPDVQAPCPEWLSETAQQTGIGVVRASAKGIIAEVSPARLRPDLESLQNTRRFFVGEASLRAFGLNKPLHYLAAVVAYAFSPDPQVAISEVWGLRATGHAIRGAQTLGLLAANGTVTSVGRSYAEAARALGFDLEASRSLTRRRLAADSPGLAALVRTILLQNPAIALLIRVLVMDGKPLTVLELAHRALFLDNGMSQALFGPPPAAGQVWQIRPSTRNILKAMLYDSGLITTPLAPKAQTEQIPVGAYNPQLDIWEAGTA